MSIENEQNDKAKKEVIGSILKNESSKVRISSYINSALKDSIIIHTLKSVIYLNALTNR